MCPNTCLSRTICLLSRYDVKGELDCFNCNTGFPQIIHFIVYKTKQLQSTFWGKNSTGLSGIFNNYKEKQSVLKAYTAALIESEATTP